MTIGAASRPRIGYGLPRMPLPLNTRLGPYQILAPLGAGGMGEVYRAHDTRLGRDVAIKVLPAHLASTPEARARFEREARTISQLNHPHICTLYDVGHQDGIDYLVMELLEGETLAHRLEKGSLPVAEVLTLGAQIAQALDRAHRDGVVHRDLKPGNVMLTKAGAKLMDFGLARAHGLAPAAGALSQSPTMSRPLTAEGMIVGTFQYMAPEQLEGKEADARSDLWALGCVLYEMATGARAFAGESQASLIAAIMERDPPAMTTLKPLTPPALEHLVHACLAKDPAERWQSARDVARTIEMTRAVSGGLAATGAPGTRQHDRKRGVTMVVAITACALFLTAAGLLLLDARRGRDLSAVTYTRLTFRHGMIHSARYSPDGKTVLYSASWDGGAPESFETLPGLVTPRALDLKQAQVLAISKNGRTVVKLATSEGVGGFGTLAEISSQGGAPREVVHDVYSADWAPAGKTLAITRRVGGMIHLEMPPGHVLYKTAGMLRSARVSPDGRWLAFHESQQVWDSRGTVVMIDLGGRVVARTREFADVRGIAWSAAGNEVWSAADQGQGTYDLVALSPGGKQRVVLHFPGQVRLLDIGSSGHVLLCDGNWESHIRGRRSPDAPELELGWLDWPNGCDVSQDGRMLLFEEQGQGGGLYYSVCVRGMDGTPAVRLGEGHACSLSPDGRFVLAVHYRPPQRLMLLPTGTEDSTSLRRGSIESYFGARWFADGKAVVFSGAERGRPVRSYVQDLAGGLPRPLTPEGTSGIHLSPDGRFLAAIAPDHVLYAVPIPSGTPRPIGQLRPGEQVLAWAPDGHSLLVGRFDTEATVFRIDVDTGRRAPWKTFSVPEPAGVTMVSMQLTADGGSYAYTFVRWLDCLYQVDGLK
jgi:Tol biopolymer transport system component